MDRDLDCAANFFGDLAEFVAEISGNFCRNFFRLYETELDGSPATAASQPTQPFAKITFTGWGSKLP